MARAKGKKLDTLKTCEICGADKAKACAGCGTTAYCSTDCQRIDWRDRGHRKVCKKIQAAEAARAEAPTPPPSPPRDVFYGPAPRSHADEVRARIAAEHEAARLRREANPEREPQSARYGSRCPICLEDWDDPMGEHKFDGRAAFAATGGAARWVAVAPCAGCAKAKGELEVAVAFAGGAAPGGSTLARVAGAVGAANDELVASEAAYVSDLKVLRDAFEGPCASRWARSSGASSRSACSRCSTASSRRSTSSSRSRRRGSCPLEAAKARARADCFEALAPELCDAYGAYVVAYASVWETWSAARTSDGDLGASSTAARPTSPEPAKLTMQALAIMPVQRIARYELLLSALRKAVEKHRRPSASRDDAAGLGRRGPRLAATDVNVAAATTTASHSLRLKVLRGAGLVDKDRSALSFVKGKSDPYCVKQTLDPDWTGAGASGDDDDDDACFDLLVAEASRAAQIFDWDQWSADDPMGEVNVKISDLLEDWGRFFAARDAHGAAVMRGDYDDPSVERSLWITPRWRKINAMHAVPVGPTDAADLEVRDWSRAATRPAAASGARR
ncbi:hypothetical protein JL720_11627 [Aureococcus anophagefferens]|nr:hypothetical protein JL720_11627 [Aureococcus anophagefferens]